MSNTANPVFDILSGIGTSRKTRKEDAGVPAIKPVKEEYDLKSDERLVQVPVKQIIPSDHQFRTEFAEADMQELVASIEVYGLVNPLLLNDSGGKLRVFAGERRLRACKTLGIEVVPAIIRQIDDQAEAELALTDNEVRSGLNPIELAEALKSLKSQGNYTNDELAKRIGKNRSIVASHLSLLNLPQTVQTQVSKGLLSYGHARALNPLPHIRAIELANLVIHDGLSVRDLEKLAKDAQTDDSKAQNASKETSSAFLSDVEKQLLEKKLTVAEDLESRGGRASVRESKNGSVEISYKFKNISDLESFVEAKVAKFSG